jgi:lipoate-protein ligase A
MLRCFSTGTEQYPGFLSSIEGEQIDILHSESNDILFNLATEDYLYEHVSLRNPMLFLWRNHPTIIIGKH